MGTRAARRLVLAFTVSLALLTASATVAGAQTPGCFGAPGVQCSTVDVPLDRSGAVPGTVRLAVRRVPATRGPSQGTVMFLAGGPGESALSVLPALAQVFSALLPNYDLVTFDQRGTGQSGPLACAALANPSGTTASAYGSCGNQLGPARQFYRSADSADDTEAVRQSIGAPQVALFGVSYGGRVAGEYVRRYPGTVSRMVLDSPSTLEGSDPFSLQRQQALRRVVGAEICARRACRSFSRSPYRDLSRLALRLRRRGLRATIYTGSGRPDRGRLTVDDLYALVALADLDPVLRAELPGAVSSARRGDGAPFARALVRTIVGLGGQGDDEPVNDVTFTATSCVEAPTAWDPAGAPDVKARTAAVNARIGQLGAGAFAPFGARTVVQGGVITPRCLLWPSVNRPPVAGGTSPVPTLVISGAEDLRTPRERASSVAGQYAGATLLNVPYTGHSAVPSDSSLCAARAAFRFLGGGPPATACPRGRRPLAVAPRAPRRFKSLRGRSRSAKTLRAARITLRDLTYQLAAASRARIGGLRGGRAVLSPRTLSVRLVGYRYVSKVRVSGRLRMRKGRLVGTIRVSGGGARRARIDVRGNGRLRARFSAAPGVTAVASESIGSPLVVPKAPPGPVVGAGPLPKPDF
ncbi:MAG TPA: alpha/beta fold hydrolase [Thermoleophilaceae bacterium]|nr:alpha/beta fold hydrolase [Thermoleophilaceae bacterium]